MPPSTTPAVGSATPPSETPSPTTLPEALLSASPAGLTSKAHLPHADSTNQALSCVATHLHSLPRSTLTTVQRISLHALLPMHRTITAYSPSTQRRRRCSLHAPPLPLSPGATVPLMRTSLLLIHTLPLKLLCKIQLLELAPDN
jgi:hypothetical protein